MTTESIGWGQRSAACQPPVPTVNSNRSKNGETRQSRPQPRHHTTAPVSSRDGGKGVECPELFIGLQTVRKDNCGISELRRGGFKGSRRDDCGRNGETGGGGRKTLDSDYLYIYIAGKVCGIILARVFRHIPDWKITQMHRPEPKKPLIPSLFVLTQLRNPRMQTCDPGSSIEQGYPALILGRNLTPWRSDVDWTAIKGCKLTEEIGRRVKAGITGLIQCNRSSPARLGAGTGTHPRFRKDLFDLLHSCLEGDLAT